MSKPHPVDFYLYFPDEMSAESASRELSRDGFSSGVSKSATPKPGAEWLCLASKQLVPTEGAIAEASQRMEGAAARHRGEYDGWEAAVVRPNRAGTQ